MTRLTDRLRNPQILGSKGLLKRIINSPVVPLQYWDKPKSGNLGDQLSPLIVESVLGRPTKLHRTGPRMLAIGSILGLADSRTVVWGAGFVGDFERLTTGARPNILAVRGPRTAELLRRHHGLHVSNFGDPALLAARLLGPSEDTRPRRLQSRRASLSDTLVIPHNVQRGAFSETQRAPGELLSFAVRDRSTIIATLGRISRASAVISTGLHGLVLAHALGIPACWVHITNPSVPQINGGQFKFKDYFDSVGAVDMQPVLWDGISTLSARQLFFWRPESDALESRIDDLLTALSAVT